jgi:hypothetical protein
VALRYCRWAHLYEGLFPLETSARQAFLSILNNEVIGPLTTLKVTHLQYIVYP